MVFHVRWIFLTTSLRIPPESLRDEGGIRRRVVRNPSHMENHTKCIFSHTLHFNQAKYNVQSCRSWKPCEMDLSHNCSLHGGMSEVCENTSLWSNLNMGNSFEQNMPSKIKNEPFWDLGRPTSRPANFCIVNFEGIFCSKQFDGWNYMTIWYFLWYGWITLSILNF